MQNSWNEGYITDIAYVFGYYRELNPIYLDFCLAFNGFQKPICNNKNNIFTYCELGLSGRNDELPLQKLLHLHGKFFACPADNAAERIDNALNFASGNLYGNFWSVIKV